MIEICIYLLTIVLPEMKIPDTVTSEEIEPCNRVRSKSVDGNGNYMRTMEMP